MEDAHRQQLQDAIKDPRHPYSYDNFLATIDAIVHHWEPNTEYEPGWTPLQWANDLKSKFTREVWEHQDLRLYTQQNIIVFLQNPSLVPNIYSKDFPVPHQFALLCGLISGDSASNTAHQHDPRFAPQDRRLPQTSGFAQHHRLRSESAFDSARALEYLDSRIIMLLARYSEKYARDQGNYSRAQQRLEQLRNKATHVRAQEAVHLVGEYMAAVYRRGWEYLPEANMIVR
ncbi:hypothetical protein JCM5353_001386 [Sporobolomyces roseus]